VEKEVESLLATTIDPKERIRLLALDLEAVCNNGESKGTQFLGALMERLGPVRASLVSHEGGMKVLDAKMQEGGIHLVLDLEGACLACGASPGTLIAIRDDLEADAQIASVSFSRTAISAMPEIVRAWFEAEGDVQIVDV